MAKAQLFPERDRKERMGAMSGFIKLRRGLKDHWIERDGYALAIFAHLLLHANWIDQKRNIGDRVEVVKRGEVRTSERQICQHLGFSRSITMRRLKALESDQIVSRRKSGKFSIFSITKYDKEEEDDPETIQKRSTNDPEAIQKRSTNDPPYKNTKNIKNTKKGRSKEERAREARSDFALPPDVDPIFRTSFEEWEQHRKELRKPLTDSAKRKLVAKHLPDPDRFRAAVNHSIQNGWQGLFEPSPDRPSLAKPGKGGQNGQHLDLNTRNLMAIAEYNRLEGLK